MDDTGHILQEQNQEQIKLKENIEQTPEFKSVFMNEFDASQMLDQQNDVSMLYGMQANSERIFELNALELDYNSSLKEKEKNALKARKLVDDKGAEELQNKRVEIGATIGDESVHAYRAKKDRKNRAKDARKDAIKAKKLLTKKTKTADDAYKNNAEINKLHYEMNVNRIKAIAKNEEQENKLIAKAKRAHLVREMENCARSIAKGGLSDKELEVASKAGYAATTEYLDMLLQAGEIKEEHVTALKSNAIYLSEYMHRYFRDKLKINIPYAHYYVAQERVEGKARFEKWAKKDPDNNKQFNLDYVLTYRMAVEAEDRLKYLNHYLKNTGVKEKFLANIVIAGGHETSLYSDIGNSLQVVKFDLDGNVLPEYQKADEWNKKYLNAITIDISTKEGLKKAKEERTQCMIDLIEKAMDVQEIIDHINDKDWIVNNYVKIIEILSTSTTLKDNLCVKDPLSKQILKEIYENNKELGKKYDNYESLLVHLNLAFSYFVRTIGYAYETRRYISDEIRTDSKNGYEYELNCMKESQSELEQLEQKEIDERFEEYKNDSVTSVIYQNAIKKGHHYKPNLTSSKLHVRYKNLIACYRHYITPDVEEKYIKTNANTKKKNWYNKNRCLEEVLRYVEFDANGNALPQYKESDEWNRAYVNAMTMETDTEEKRAAAKEARKTIFKEFVSVISDLEDVVEHITDIQWILKNMEMVKWKLGIVHVFDDDMCKRDDLNEEILKEMKEENPDLEKKLQRARARYETLPTILNITCCKVGFNFQKGEYLTEEHMNDPTTAEINQMTMDQFKESINSTK